MIRNQDMLFELAKILGRETEFLEVLNIVVQKSAQIFEADLAIILMLNPDTRETVKTIIRDRKSINQRQYHNIRIHVGGWIVDEGKPFSSDAIQKDKRFAEGLFDTVPVKSVAGVPLMIEGIIIGALILLYHDSTVVTHHDFMLSLENFAAVSVPFLRNTQKIRQYFNPSKPSSTLLLKYNQVGLVGKSPAFIELLDTIEAAAQSDTRVLLVGKTGTGKELIARAIHNFSLRANGPFVAVDCGAIPRTLLESEFFGYRRGAFTGAHTDHQGLFIEACSGTLFLDEINNLPIDLQSKFLRALEEGKVRPLGSDKMVETDVRIVASSSVSLQKLVEEKLFREDLFFRLNVYPVSVPDLAQRKEDIPILANHFLMQYTGKQHKQVQNFHEEIIDFLKYRKWTGNIRELENFVERMVTIASKETKTIRGSDLPSELKEELNIFNMERKEKFRNNSLKEQLDLCEKEIIKNFLIESGWNQSEAARRLKTSEGNIRRKIHRFNITPE